VSQKIFSERVYAISCWALLAITVLLAVSSHVVLMDGVELSIGGASLPIKFVSAKMFVRVLASLCWCLIFVVGRWHEKYVNKDFLPIGFCVGSLGVLIWRYPDIVSGTAYQDVSRWWLVLLLVLGCLTGMAISTYIDGWFSRRTEDESKGLGLPKNSMLAMVLLKTATLMCFVSLAGIVLFVVFYDGPWALPVTWLASFIVLFVQRADKRMSGVLKKYSDYAEYNAILDLYSALVTNGGDKRLSLDFSPCQIQVEKAKKIKDQDLKYEEKGCISSHTTINQCGEPLLRIDWQPQVGNRREYYLSFKEAYKYWEAYQWLCRNDKEFFNGKHVLSKEKCLLYAMQDRLLREKGHSLILWRMNVQDDTDLEIIIKATSSINVQFPPGWTLLLLAVANGFLEGVRLLLKYGADTELANANGVTPVLYAVRYDNVECLKLLIDAGANVCVEDNRGYSALMVAAEHNCKSVVPVLLTEGVNPKKRTCSGRTALDIALANQAGDIANMLRNRIKEIDSSKRRNHKRKKR